MTDPGSLSVHQPGRIPDGRAVHPSNSLMAQADAQNGGRFPEPPDHSFCNTGIFRPSRPWRDQNVCWIHLFSLFKGDGIISHHAVTAGMCSNNMPQAVGEGVVVLNDK